MSNEQEYGLCPICGKAASLERTYFIYDIPCRCCGCKRDGRNMHFELVRHCPDCRPSVPTAITPILQCGIDAVEYKARIGGILPYAIDGPFDIGVEFSKMARKLYETETEM